MYTVYLSFMQTLRMVITSALGLSGEGYFSHWPLSFRMLSTLVLSDFQVHPCQPREKKGERMREGGRAGGGKGREGERREGGSYSQLVTYNDA